MCFLHCALKGLLIIWLFYTFYFHFCLFLQINSKNIFIGGKKKSNFWLSSLKLPVCSFILCSYRVPFNTCHFPLMFSWKGFVQKEVAISNSADNDNTLPSAKHLLTSSLFMHSVIQKMYYLVSIRLICPCATESNRHWLCNVQKLLWNVINIRKFALQKLKNAAYIECHTGCFYAWFFLTFSLLNCLLCVHVCTANLLPRMLVLCKLTCNTRINQPSHRGAVRLFFPLSPLTHRRCGFLSFRVMGYW